jgi:hypothetical protein
MFMLCSFSVKPVSPAFRPQYLSFIGAENVAAEAGRGDSAWPAMPRPPEYAATLHAGRVTPWTRSPEHLDFI